MVTSILTAVGGLGLFLLGMNLLTGSLRSLAGSSLRRLIARYTRTPVSGAVTGAAATAVVQSSSAITVTAIGFVGAGLMTFQHALGIIFGANIGTTITGWIVALLGFKFEIGLFAWPALLVGALCQTLAQGKVAKVGLAICGLSLLLIGIETMQVGMKPFEGAVTPDVFPGDSLIGRLQLLLIGVVITLVTQSSSAGVATAMVALSTGSISFPQAAAMVIGMDVGTTVTAALATIGGSTAMRQTGFAHVIYNLMTGGMAFILLGPYALFVGDFVASGGMGSAQIAVVGFHSFFNALGVILVLPFTRYFARMIQRAFPSSASSLTRHLDIILLSETRAAVAALAQTVAEIRMHTHLALVRLLNEGPGHSGPSEQLASIDTAIEEALAFAAKIRSGEETFLSARTASALHALDHLSRLAHRMRQQERIASLIEDNRLSRLKRILVVSLKRSHERPAGSQLDYFERLRHLMQRSREVIRTRKFVGVVAGDSDLQEVVRKLEGARWLLRVSYHIWRIEKHLAILLQERL